MMRLKRENVGMFASSWIQNRLSEIIFEGTNYIMGGGEFFYDTDSVYYKIKEQFLSSNYYELIE